MDKTRKKQLQTLSKNIRILILFVIVSTILNVAVFAAKPTPQPQKVQVRAKIGEFSLSVSGYQSPYASIVMSTLDGSFLASTVADSKGNFSFTTILVQRGFLGFCLTAVDFRRLGDSKTCVNLSPVSNNISETNLFLPPTFGLYKAVVGVNDGVTAFGYSMPSASVTVHINNKEYQTISDAAGYYFLHITDVSQGEYKLFADARFGGKDSLKPVKQLDLRVLSLWEQFINWLKSLIPFFTSGIGLFLLAIPLLYVLLVLLHGRFPHEFTWMDRFIIHLPKLPEKRSKKLHHAWFVGY